MTVLEICADSVSSAFNAQLGGADRVELCSDLTQGGITPSHGLISFVKPRLTIPVHVLIRPRPGNFVYSPDEIQVILADIEACKSLLCDGVVVGVLKPDHHIDVEQLEVLVQAAQPMSVTFHRAFDDAVDRARALEEIIQAGCERILTSGGADTAVEGSGELQKLIALADERIIILPAGGIRPGNVAALIKATGAKEVHASASRHVNRSQILESRFDTAERRTDVDQVRALKQLQ